MVDMAHAKSLPSIPAGEGKLFYENNIVPDESGRSRPLDPAKVKEIQDSIEKLGLLQPIGIREDKNNPTVHHVIFGAHRFKAWQNKWNSAKVGDDDKEKGRWQQIMVLRFPSRMTDEQAKLAELDENLARNELSTPERKKLVGERMKLAKKLFKEPAQKHAPAHPHDAGWTPPSQNDVCKQSCISERALQKWYKEFRKDHDDVNWNKQSESNYDAFCDWLIAKAKEAEDEKRKKDAESKADYEVVLHDKAVKALQDYFDHTHDSRDAVAVIAGVV